MAKRKRQRAMPGRQPDAELRRRGMWEGGSNCRLLLLEGWLGGAGERWAAQWTDITFQEHNPGRMKNERRVGVSETSQGPSPCTPPSGRAG